MRTIQKKTPIIKFMSFNIAHGLGADGRVDLERTAQTIEDSCADIIGLQEVDKHFSKRSFFQNQVQWLADRLNMHVAYGPNLDYGAEDEGLPRCQYGNLVLSKYPIKYWENHLLAKVDEDFGTDEQRGLLETIIDVDGELLRFFNAHLSLKDAELKVNVQQILEIMQSGELPRVLVGDFNAPPSNAHIEKLRQEFMDVFLKMKRGDTYTYPAPFYNSRTGEILEPVTRIDYIFTDKDFEVLQTAAVMTSVSDHLPIAADLALPIRDRSKRVVQTDEKVKA